MDLRQRLEQELQDLLAEEARSADTGGGEGHHNYQIVFAPLLSQLSKVERTGGVFEAVLQDSSKLRTQVEACRALSQRLTLQVKRLDSMHTRASDTLVYVDDILNLKEARNDILEAVRSGDLSRAVGILKRVHSIQSLSVQPTDDYLAIKTAEEEVRLLVRKEFSNAIESSNVEAVMALCPLLQSLGLETEARDEFLAFMDRAVFTAIAADRVPTDGSVDLATAYAQALSHVFNASHSVMQQYLPLVIEGMEASLGDVHFIRRLHGRCEREAGLILKRFMKHRQVRDLVSAMRAEPSAANTSSPVSPAEVHTMLDELTVLIQYSCTFGKYVDQLCAGAEARPRKGAEGKVVVFAAPTDFSRMLEEMTQRFYLEGERWLVAAALRAAFLRHSDGAQTLDECFFVLQRCSQRSVATHSAAAADAVIRFICSQLKGELLKEAQGIASGAVARIASALVSRMTRHYRMHDPSYLPDAEQEASALNLSRSLQNIQHLYAMNLNPAAAESDEAKISAAADALVLIATCQRYIERLGKDTFEAVEQNFSSPPEVERLKKLRDEFTSSVNSFQQVKFIDESVLVITNI